jgi:hypothetical protein
MATAESRGFVGRQPIENKGHLLFALDFRTKDVRDENKGHPLFALDFRTKDVGVLKLL